MIPALIGSLPTGVASFFIFRTTGAGALARIVIETPAGFRNLPDEVRSQILADFARGAALALTLQFLGALFILIATHLIVADDERGMSDVRQRLSLTRLLRAAAAAYPRTLVGATIASLGSLATIGLGLALWSIPLRSVGIPSGAATGVALISLLVLLIPGLWLAASVSMTTPIAVIVGDGGIVSIQRSAALVRGRGDRHHDLSPGRGLARTACCATHPGGRHSAGCHQTRLASIGDDIRRRRHLGDVDGRDRSGDHLLVSVPFAEPPPESGLSPSRARDAAACSAAFFDRPSPVPATEPLILTVAVNQRSWSGPAPSTR